MEILFIGDKSNSVVFDNGKIKQYVPDFKCEVEWVAGLRRSLAWFEAHPEFHGGRVWVESATSPQGEAGNGATFRFTLPLHKTTPAG